MSDPRIDAVLTVMAEDAFEVMNWARRQGLKRDRQLQEVVEAFKKALANTKSRIVLDPVKDQDK